MFGSIVKRGVEYFGRDIIEAKAYSLVDSRISELFGTRPVYSGANVSHATALSVPAVLQAVRLISEAIGSTPLKLYKDVEGSKEAAKSHRAYKLAHNRANFQTGAGKLRVDLTVDALLYGNGFALVGRNFDGEIIQLERIKPDRVQIFEDDLTGSPALFRINTGKGHTDYGPEDILHISTFNGKSLITLGREAIGVAMTMEKHAAQFFAGGARPSAVITLGDKVHNNEAGSKTVANILADYHRMFEGDGPSRPLILPNGGGFNPLTMTSTDAQFLENRVFQISEIARLFGLPPTMVFDFTRATWSNTEQMAASFLQLCLRPWLDRWQDAYATVLLTEDERDNFYFEFVIDDLLRTEAAQRAEIFGKYIASGVMNPNEVRAAMNLPARDGGDEYGNPYTSTNTPAPTTAPAKEAA